MNKVSTFNNPEFGTVRTTTINDEPYFVGKDVAEILGYERPTKAISDHVDTEDRDAVPIQDSIGRMQNTPSSTNPVFTVLFFQASCQQRRNSNAG